MIEEQLRDWLAAGLRVAAPGLGLDGDLPELELQEPRQKEHWYERFTIPYLPPKVGGTSFQDSPRLSSLLRGGRLYLSLDDAIALAIENLVAKSESLAAHAAEDDDGEVNLILFQTMDGYDASRVLLPTLFELVSA